MAPALEHIAWGSLKPPPDALLLFLQDLAGVTGVSACSDKHLAVGIWHGELVTGRLMSWPRGGRLDGLLFCQKSRFLLFLLLQQDCFPVPPRQSNDVSLWLEKHWCDETMSRPPPAAALVQVVWAHSILYKQELGVMPVFSL